MHLNHIIRFVVVSLALYSATSFKSHQQQCNALRAHFTTRLPSTNQLQFNQTLRPMSQPQVELTSIALHDNSVVTYELLLLQRQIQQLKHQLKQLKYKSAAFHPKPNVYTPNTESFNSPVNDFDSFSNTVNRLAAVNDLTQPTHQHQHQHARKQHRRSSQANSTNKLKHHIHFNSHPFKAANPDSATDTPSVDEKVRDSTPSTAHHSKIRRNTNNEPDFESSSDWHEFGEDVKVASAIVEDAVASSAKTVAHRVDTATKRAVHHVTDTIESGVKGIGYKLKAIDNLIMQKIEKQTEVEDEDTTPIQIQADTQT